MAGDVRNMRDTTVTFWRDVISGRSMRIFVAIAALCLGVLWLRGTSLTHFMWLWPFIVLTLACEAVNTALEELCEQLWPRLQGETPTEAAARQPQVARLKHLAAAVVFVSGVFGTIPAFLIVLFNPR